MPSATTPRRDSRRDYRHFPPEYTALLHKFDKAGSAALGPMAENDARAGLRDLYRFKMFLSSGCDADPEDAHCRSLLTIASRCILRVEPIATTDPRGSHMIVLALNPIVAAMQEQSS